MTLPGILPLSQVYPGLIRDPKLGGLDEHQARDQLGLEEDESSEDEDDEDAEELKKQKAQVLLSALLVFSHHTCLPGEVGLREEQIGEEEGREGVDGHPHKGEENQCCGGVHQEGAKQS